MSSGSRKHILIIEDNPSISESLGEALREQGHEVHVVSNGKDGLLYLIKEKRPDLILLDLFMPTMNGVEFRQRQLQIPMLATIPTVVMSADAYVKRRCVPLHVSKFLKKPFDLEELLVTVDKIS